MGNERTRMWRVPFCREGSRHAQGLCPCRAAASCSSDFRCILASLSMLLAASPCSQLFPASLQSCQEWIARTIFHVWMFGDASVCQSASPWPLLPHLFFLAHHTVSTSTVLGPVSLTTGLAFRSTHCFPLRWPVSWASSHCLLRLLSVWAVPTLLHLSQQLGTSSLCSFLASGVNAEGNSVRERRGTGELVNCPLSLVAAWSCMAQSLHELQAGADERGKRPSRLCSKGTQMRSV